jgi:hypothetical protein
MLTLVADPAEIHFGLSNPSPTGGVASENHSQLRARFTRIVKSLPNARTEVLEVISNGSVVVTKEHTTGLPGDGSDTGVAMYRVRSGKIDLLWLVSSLSGS